MTKPKFSKRRNWVERMPEIRKMILFMTDAEIAKQYNVETKNFRDIRKYHGCYRKGEAIPKRPAAVKKNMPMIWDFSPYNLAI